MEPSEPRATDSLFWVIALIIIAMTTYIGSYFVLVRPGASVWFAPTGTKVLTRPDYRGLPPQIFAPMHYVDRSFVRPQLWGSGRPGLVRQQNGGVTNTTTLPTPLESTTPAGRADPNSVTNFVQQAR